MRPRVLARGVAALTLAALLGGCSGSDLTPPPAQTRVDVDTPELRRAKQAAGVEACPDRARGAGSELPEAVLPCLGGGEDVRLSGISGPVVMPLWASWCDPCKDELPLFERLSQELEGRATVVGVDYQDTQPDLALELLADSGATFPQIADPGGTLADSYRIRGLPGILWVGQDGAVTFRNDRVRTYGELEELVSSQLGIDVGSAG